MFVLRELDCTVCRRRLGMAREGVLTCLLIPAAGILRLFSSWLSETGSVAASELPSRRVLTAVADPLVSVFLPLSVSSKDSALLLPKWVRVTTGVRAGVISNVPSGRLYFAQALYNISRLSDSSNSHGLSF